MDGRDRRANTPAQARNFLDAMRGLFRWAVKARLVKIDPTVGVDNPPRPIAQDQSVGVRRELLDAEYEDERGDTPASNEVVLIHRKSPTKPAAFTALAARLQRVAGERRT
jgi:hypothetical protein